MLTWDSVWEKIRNFSKSNIGKPLSLLNPKKEFYFKIKEVSENYVRIDKLPVKMTKEMFLKVYEYLKSKNGEWVRIGASRVNTDPDTVESVLKKHFFKDNPNGLSTAPWFAAILVSAQIGIEFNGKSRGQKIRFMEKETINIPPITLEWSEWVYWDEIKKDARKKDGIKIPNKKSGVYEVKYKGSEERLTIGKASDLRMRVRQGLVKGKVPHSAGKKIRANEDTSRIVVRWAITDRPAAAEEGLHKKHLSKFGKLPKYVKHT